MIRRSRRVLPATIVAVLVLAACVLIAVSCVQALIGQPPWLPFAAIAGLGAGLTVNSPLVIAAAIILGVLGLVLLVAALAPGATTVLPLEQGGTAVVSGVTRNSLRAALAATAGDVDGVDRARVRVGKARVRATVRTPLHVPGALSEQVQAALDDRLRDIAPLRSPRIRVRVSTRSN